MAGYYQHLNLYVIFKCILKIQLRKIQIICRKFQKNTYLIPLFDFGGIKATNLNFRGYLNYIHTRRAVRLIGNTILSYLLKDF